MYEIPPSPCARPCVSRTQSQHRKDAPGDEERSPTDADPTVVPTTTFVATGTRQSNRGIGSCRFSRSGFWTKAGIDLSTTQRRCLRGMDVSYLYHIGREPTVDRRHRDVKDDTAQHTLEMCSAWTALCFRNAVYRREDFESRTSSQISRFSSSRIKRNLLGPLGEACSKGEATILPLDKSFA